MRRTTLVVAAVLVTVAVLPGGAVAATDGGVAQPGDEVDECKNADNGPGGDGGPPGFVGGLVPDFLSGLLSSLPVPGFLKSLFGASGC